FQFGVAGERAHLHTTIHRGDVRQFLDAVDVHERTRRGQPHVQQRHEALTAGQDLAVRPDLGEDREGLAEVGGSVVLEGWWFHEIEGFPWSGVAFSSSLRLGNSLLSAGLLAGAARRRDGLLAALLVA